MAVPTGTLVASMTGDIPAGSHFVSPTGTATWAQATNVATPCSTATAMANAAAGDHALFRAGTYDVPAYNVSYRCYYEPANSGTAGNPITFMAYPGETPLFDGIVGTAEPTAGIMGVFRQAYIEFDGLSFQAEGGTRTPRMTIYSDSEVPPLADPQPTHHITVKNCTFNGGARRDNGGANVEALRIEDTTDITVQNCTFYNVLDTVDYHNTSAIKLYHTGRTILEHNLVYSCSCGIYDKSLSSGTVIRYNYIHDCGDHGIYAPSNGYDCLDGFVYHNLITRCDVAPIEIAADDGAGQVTGGWEIYNNTIYQPTACGGNPVTVKYNTTGLHYYNNILVGIGSDYSAAQVRIASGTIAEFDYNQYGATGFQIRNEGVPYTVLANWQATTVVGGGNPDTHSLASNPQFANTSGNLNQIADFALGASSPCRGTGKSGADMGCDVTQVGVQ